MNGSLFQKERNNEIQHQPSAGIQQLAQHNDTGPKPASVTGAGWGKGGDIRAARAMLDKFEAGNNTRRKRK